MAYDPNLLSHSHFSILNRLTFHAERLKEFVEEGVSRSRSDYLECAQRLMVSIEETSCHFSDAVYTKIDQLFNRAIEKLNHFKVATLERRFLSPERYRSIAHECYRSLCRFVGPISLESRESFTLSDLFHLCRSVEIFYEFSKNGLDFISQYRRVKEHIQNLARKIFSVFSFERDVIEQEPFQVVRQMPQSICSHSQILARVSSCARILMGQDRSEIRSDLFAALNLARKCFQPPSIMNPQKLIFQLDEIIILLEEMNQGYFSRERFFEIAYETYIRLCEELQTEPRITRCMRVEYGRVQGLKEKILSCSPSMEPLIIDLQAAFGAADFEIPISTDEESPFSSGSSMDDCKELLSEFELDLKEADASDTEYETIFEVTEYETVSEESEDEEMPILEPKAQKKWCVIF